MSIGNRIGATVRIAANASLTLLSLTLTLILASLYILPPGVLPFINARTSHETPKLDLSPLDLPSGANIVLFLKVGCQYCTKSAPLYKQIVQRAKATDRHVIAVSPDDRKQMLSYLNSLDLAVEDVRQVQLDRLGVTGTPTLVLSRSGVPSAVWRGLQSESNQAQILAELFRP